MMIAEKTRQESARMFFEILLIGEIFTPPGSDVEKKSIAEILLKHGIRLIRSDFTILDETRIGGSTVTIAKYSVEYVQDGIPTGRRVGMEGSIALQTDELGNRVVRFSSRPYPFQLDMSISGSEMSLVCDHT